MVVMNPSASVGDVRDVGSISGLGRSLGRGHSNSLQDSCLENPMDRGAWWATVHRVTKSRTWWEWLSTHSHKGDWISRNCAGKNWFFTDDKSPDEASRTYMGTVQSCQICLLCSVFWSTLLSMYPLTTSFSMSAHHDYVPREEQRANGQRPNSPCQLTAFFMNFTGKPHSENSL